jgi:hypothetical protein
MFLLAYLDVAGNSFSMELCNKVAAEVHERKMHSVSIIHVCTYVAAVLHAAYSKIPLGRDRYSY